MCVSFDYHGTSVYKLASQRSSVPILDRPMEVLKCLKFPSLIVLLCACADEFFDIVTEGMVNASTVKIRLLICPVLV